MTFDPFQPNPADASLDAATETAALGFVEAALAQEFDVGLAALVVRLDVLRGGGRLIARVDDFVRELPSVVDKATLYGDLGVIEAQCGGSGAATRLAFLTDNAGRVPGPDRLAFIDGAARIAASLGDAKQARALVADALAVSSDPTIARSAAKTAAMVGAILSDIDLVIKAATIRGDGDEEVLFAQARCAVSTGDLPAAQQALSRRPHDRRLVAAVARVHLLLDEPQAAADLLADGADAEEVRGEVIDALLASGHRIPEVWSTDALCTPQIVLGLHRAGLNTQATHLAATLPDPLGPPLDTDLLAAMARCLLAVGGECRDLGRRSLEAHRLASWLLDEPVSARARLFVECCVVDPTLQSAISTKSAEVERACMAMSVDAAPSSPVQWLMYGFDGDDEQGWAGRLDEVLSTGQLDWRPWAWRAVIHLLRDQPQAALFCARRAPLLTSAALPHLIHARALLAAGDADRAADEARWCLQSSGTHHGRPQTRVSGVAALLAMRTLREAGDAAAVLEFATQGYATRSSSLRLQEAMALEALGRELEAAEAAKRGLYHLNHRENAAELPRERGELERLAAGPVAGAIANARRAMNSDTDGGSN